ncbi:unnamed protein product [Bemisia tabaci]|uniref:Dynein axonemal light chain 1 n=1 Tax=Bemisia tabaci TaxID=7038 RepID=A0A9P0A2K0_BEMTA|nr:PREDICTED: dynein light chain 1, axonemal [Bemisia tabaci]CAH0385000.1 unnamed protein product [Bemisia tabaci]
MQAKPTTIKEALKKWEEKTGQDSTQATDIGMQFQWLPIEKMDNTLGTLVKCEKLSLSTNMIEKISGLSGMKNLKILSLGRNYIKAFTGLEPVGDTLEELWISYNLIDKVKGVAALRKLKVLHMSNNLVKDWGEVAKLQECPSLIDLLFVGNPICENLDEGVWRTECTKRLPNLKKLDGETVLTDYYI